MPFSNTSQAVVPKIIMLNRGTAAISLLAVAALLGPFSCCAAAPVLSDPPLTSGHTGTLTFNSSVINVLSFGASGDGTTDDSAAFNAALAYLLTRPAPARGGVLYVPAGSYRITSTLAVAAGSFTLQGDGWVSNIIVRALQNCNT